MDFEGGKMCMNTHVKRSIWAQQDGERASKKNTGTVEKHKSLHIRHYSICPWGRWHKPGIQSYVIKFCRWPPSLKQSQPPHKVANSSAFMQRRALQSFSGVSMQMTSRDCATKSVHNTKFKLSLEKAFASLPFDSEDWDNWTSSHRCPTEQESCRRGTYNQNSRRKEIQNTEVWLFILRWSFQLDSHTSLYSLLFFKTQTQALCAGSHQEMQVPFWVLPQCKPLSKHTFLGTLHTSPLF